MLGSRAQSSSSDEPHRFCAACVAPPENPPPFTEGDELCAMFDEKQSYIPARRTLLLLSVCKVMLLSVCLSFCRCPLPVWFWFCLFCFCLFMLLQTDVEKLLLPVKPAASLAAPKYVSKNSSGREINFHAGIL